MRAEGYTQSFTNDESRNWYKPEDMFKWSDYEHIDGSDTATCDL